MPHLVTIYNRDSKKEELAKHDLLPGATTTLDIVLDGGLPGLTSPLRLNAHCSAAAYDTSYGSVTIMVHIFDAIARHTP